jgi:hypothetical protein
MRALVVYESMFGNTQAIAEAIAEGLATRADVEVVEVGSAPTDLPAGIRLLVIGGPTHAHGMTKPGTRDDAAARAQERLVSRGLGIREWLSLVAPPASGTWAAAFDTRLRGPAILWGSAAKGAARALREAGFSLIVPSESFVVEGPGGSPFDRLPPGELARARRWGADLVSRVAAEAWELAAV